jgi:hypothetical protein
MSRAAASPRDADDDRFRRAHQERARMATPDGTVEINLTESPLRWLASRRDAAGQPFLSGAEVEAGERFRRDFTMAGLSPRLGAQWAAPVERGGANSSIDYSDVVVAARQRLSQATEAVGPDFASLLLDVCGFLKGLEQAERERQWPIRAAKVVLKLALGALARAYGLEEAARGPENSRGIRAWSAGAAGGQPAPPS